MDDSRIRALTNAMQEFGIDFKKMPLGKISEAHITKGYEILKNIMDIISSGRNDHSQLLDLSSHFYTIIPHSFGATIPPVIRDAEMVTAKMSMLEALADTIAALKSDRSSATNIPLQTPVKLPDPPLDNLKADDDFVTTAEPDKISIFLRTLPQQGIHLHDSVTITRTASGLGLLARRALTPNTIIATIPQHTFLTCTKATIVPALLQIAHARFNCGDNDDVVTLLQAHVGLMPELPGPTVLLCSEHAELLEESTLGNALFAKGAALGEMYEQLLSERGTELEWLTMEMFGWADAAFWSRCIGIPMSAGEATTATTATTTTMATSATIADSTQQQQLAPAATPCAEQLCVVPVLDLCNHSATPNARWEFHHGTRVLTLITTTDVAADQEITISYGDKSNDELMFLYGFSISNNPNDTFTLPALLHSDSDSYAEQKLQLLRALHLPPRVVLQHDGTITTQSQWVQCVLTCHDLDRLAASCPDITQSPPLWALRPAIAALRTDVEQTYLQTLLAWQEAKVRSEAAAVMVEEGESELQMILWYLHGQQAVCATAYRQLQTLLT
eukprot:TRINITY_DN11392_c0_g1_i1.p1 TRINITY_DN11392_c0_g1~~TRINITY_DN11392_c0_g1_i1.p1  ORF type:complete len:576 (-),score=127.09 TRINITY_DN11392_c0_g1_i1:247-1926(-)